MRLTVDDFSNADDVYKRSLVSRVIVMLDGVKVERCIVADEEQGYVEVLVAEPPPDVEEWPTYIMHGKVEIVDPLK
jgi:hypothetical protein